jgi:DNA-binding transcriptional LysR family regulator
MVYKTVMKAVHIASVDMNLLLALHALLEERHVTRAAARIGITQSAMSHALSRLRTLLDDPLFVRSPRGMVPTPHALSIAEPLARALGQIEDVLSRRTAFDPKTARRTFRIGAGDYGEVLFAAPLAALVEAEAPNLEIAIEPISLEVPRALETGAVDVIVGYGSDDWPGIFRKQISVDKFVCVVREGNPAVTRSLSLDTYVAVSHVLVSPSGTGRAYVDAILQKRGLTRRIGVRVPHFLVAPLVVSRTDLILTVPERVARTFEGAIGLKIVKCPIELDDIRMSQMWHERMNLDPAHVWLRNALDDAANGRRRKRHESGA